MTAIVTTNLSLPRLRMIELLAACPTLQAALPHSGSATPTTAQASIYSPFADDHWLDETDESLGIVHPRPRVIVQHNDYARRKLGTAYGGTSGSLFVTFEFTPDTAANGDANLELASFEESLGLILDEMEARIGQDKGAGETLYSDSTSAHLNIVNYALVAGPAGSYQEEELGELFYAAVFVMAYT